MMLCSVTLKGGAHGVRLHARPTRRANRSVPRSGGEAAAAGRRWAVSCALNDKNEGHATRSSGPSQLFSLICAAGASAALALPPSALAVSQDLTELEKEIFFGVLGIGSVAVIVLRLGAAASRSPSLDGPAAEYSVSGRLRVPQPPVDVTPRASAADPLLQQLFATEVNPYDPVSTVMVPRAKMVTARAKDTVASISLALERFTGVAVVADDCPTRVIGVFSRKDQQDASMSDTVGAHMTTPALTIAETTRIVDASALMLKHEVHRLMVLDRSGSLSGIVTRTDVFTALLNSYKQDAETCSDTYGNGQSPGAATSAS